MSTTERARITLDLSPAVAGLLEHVSDVTGANKTQLVLAALNQVLPQYLERADAMKKRHNELIQRRK